MAVQLLCLNITRPGVEEWTEDIRKNTPLSLRLTLSPIMEETEGQHNILVTPLTDMLKEEPIKQHRLFSPLVAGISMAAGQREWETEYQ